MAANFVVCGVLFDMPVRSALVRLSPVVGACGFLAVATWAASTLTATAAPSVRLLACVVAGGLAYGLTLRLLARDFFETGLVTLRDALTRRRPVPEPAR